MAEILIYSPGARGDYVELRQASKIFLDACFIFKLLQEDQLCIELLNQSIDKDCAYFINSVVHSEIMHVLLRSTIIMDGYNYHIKNTEEVISPYCAKIIAEDISQRDTDFIKCGQLQRVSVDWQTIKMHLSTQRGKDQFGRYFNEVNQQINDFMETYEVHVIELDQEACQKAQLEYTTNLLNGADSHHYASYKLGPLGADGRRTGPLDYLFTLDGDFERVTGPGTIIKVAS